MYHVLLIRQINHRAPILALQQTFQVFLSMWITIRALRFPLKSMFKTLIVSTGRMIMFFNIKAIGSDKSGSAYVTPGYNNYIILDSNFMRYYYTVFDGSSQGITIYKASAPTKAWVYRFDCWVSHSIPHPCMLLLLCQECTLKEDFGRSTSTSRKHKHKHKRRH